MLYKKIDCRKEIRIANLATEYNLVLALVGQNRDVLEIGCSTGYFTRLLSMRGCKVVAIELDPRAVKKAKKYAYKVILGNVEDAKTLQQINKKFDIILCMHILEHLVDPWRFLSKIKKYLKSDGKIIVTIPNVACWPVRVNLFLKGKFEYSDMGILDRTHLRFFTFGTARELLCSSGYSITNWQICLEKVPFSRRLASISFLNWVNHYWSKFMLKHFPNLCGAVFMFEIKPASGSE